MLDEKAVEEIVREVLAQLGAGGGKPTEAETAEPGEAEIADITDITEKQKILLENALDTDALKKMKSKTNARIGVGRAGPRLKTRALLTLRADHAAARDAVFSDVDSKLLDKLELFTVQTKCADKNMHLTRPDMGRQLSDEAMRTISEKCKKNPKVQIYASDGLSSKAIEANLENILPAITEGLAANGVSAGTPFFVKYGRVPAMDIVSQTLGAEVTCVLIGERPGLATAESMSAYIAYRASPGMPEARRTVVSNIHKDGTTAVEAGAYISDIIVKMLELKTSGVDLKL